MKHVVRSRDGKFTDLRFLVGCSTRRAFQGLSVDHVSRLPDQTGNVK